jgi:hypothetical protein
MSANRDTAEETAQTTDTEEADDTTVESATEEDAQDDKRSEQQDDPVKRAATAVSPVTMPAAREPSNLAEVQAQLRESAAEIAEIAAQAGRLGIAVDAAKALRDGTAPEALRKLVLQRASATADARDIVAAPPSPVLPKSTESPIVAAAKKAASAGSGG